MSPKPFKNCPNGDKSAHLFTLAHDVHFVYLSQQLTGHQTMEFFEMCASLITQLAR